MVSFGIVELFFLLCISSGLGHSANLLPVKDYFEKMNLETDIDSVMGLATEDPQEPRTQFRQCMALRFLGLNKNELKTSPKYAQYRQQLEEIAQGKLSRDRCGFSKDFASETLAAIDEKPRATDTVKIDPLEAFQWFPQNANFLGAVEGRNFPRSEQSRRLLESLTENVNLFPIPNEQRERVYTEIEALGNFRLDCISMALVYSEDRLKMELYLRMTGKGNAEWIKQRISATNGVDDKWTEVDKQVSTFVLSQRPPAMAVIGDTDFVFCGHPSTAEGQGELLSSLLERRSQKGPHPANGPHQADLARIPANSLAHIAGELKKGFPPIPLPVSLPEKIFAFLQPNSVGLELRAEATLPQKEDADLIQKLATSTQAREVASLKTMKEMPPIPFLDLAPLITALESLKVQTQDKKLISTISLPGELLSTLEKALEGWYTIVK